MESSRVPGLVAEVVLSVAAALALAAAALAGAVPACAELVQLVSGPFLIALEFLFRIFESNEAILLVSALVLVLALLRGPLSKLIARIPGAAGPVADLLLYGSLAVLVLLAQAYLVLFALLSQRIYFAAALGLGLVASLATRRLVRGAGDDRAAEEPSMRDVPVTLLVGFLAAYLLLGMVQGHLATPLVYWLSATLAGLSADQPWLYRLLVVALFAAPLLPWLPRALARLQGRPRRLALVAPLALLPCVLLPTRAAVICAGLLSVVGLCVALSLGRFAPLRLIHPDPRRLLARLLMFSLVAANATAVHYLGTMWRCDGEAARHPAVRRVSQAAGAFAMATTSDGAGLLVSLREPRQVLAVDLTRGTSRVALDLSSHSGGTGHLFSWVEPENLLRLGTGADQRFLLLQAVSDDQERNQLVLLDHQGRMLRTLTRLNGAGVSDFTTDGRGRLYCSTEFHGKVHVLDQARLTLLQTMTWPGAETNRILVAPDRGRIYSIGLWSDPYLRAMDLSSRRQVATLRVGTLSWDMALDPGRQRILVPRFLSGQVLVVDASKMSVVRRLHAGFGARTVALDPALRLLYVGAMYDSTVSVFELGSGRLLQRLRFGGHIKRVHVDRRTHKAYVGCDCGIFELDGTTLARGALTPDAPPR